MRAKTSERHQARALRKQGLSFREIKAIVGVSKGTLNLWLKDIELTPDQKQHLLDRAITGREKARMRGAWQNREKHRARVRTPFEAARAEFPQRINDPLFTTGIVLYWAEGSKTTRRFQFMNSDPVAVRTMVEWLVRCARIPTEKIVASVQVHRVYADCGFEKFWEAVTGLSSAQFRAPYFKPTPHKVKKNPTYMGCCRLEVRSSDLLSSSDLFWKLRAWQRELARHLEIFLPSSLLDEATV